ncbi:hypothetical protein ACFZAC_26135 [Pseudomonas fluorescens]|uniref:hypothetical protein n=1 Tax=Pseudomonas fluorescens TaxID=294 RepID=UPI003749446E
MSDHLHLISWRDAKAAGLRKYFSGTPCIRGGIAERLVSGRCLCDACRAEKNSKKRHVDAMERQRRQVARK